MWREQEVRHAASEYNLRIIRSGGRIERSVGERGEDFSLGPLALRRTMAFFFYRFITRRNMIPLSHSKA